MVLKKTQNMSITVKEATRYNEKPIDRKSKGLRLVLSLKFSVYYVNRVL